ncbi:hypothetical protein Syun_004673 [Stephania yunnanensis]|uniref:Uncharacterized protein n=1 Tax=Stephania yunnanensis TaxID=152371 RepID=A0AAP0L3Y2_9MAGN
MATRAASDLSERVAHLEHTMAMMGVPMEAAESSMAAQHIEGLEMLVASLVAMTESQKALYPCGNSDSRSWLLMFVQ